MTSQTYRECWELLFSLYQWTAEQGWLMMYLTLLPCSWHHRYRLLGIAFQSLPMQSRIGLVHDVEAELANLIECLDKASTTYGMEIRAKKTKLMTNNTSGINTDIKVNGQKLETVTSFKYLGSVMTDEGSKPKILSRIAQTTAALTSSSSSIP